MRSSYCAENSFPSKEGFAANTSVFTKSLTKNGKEVSSKNQFGLFLYSTDLTADAAGLLGSEVTVVTLFEDYTKRIRSLYLEREKRPHLLARSLFSPSRAQQVRELSAQEKKIRNPVKISRPS